MRPLVRAARVLLFLLERPRLVMGAGAAVGVIAVIVGVRSAARPPDARAAREPAFCKNLDPKDVYLWGEVGGERPDAVRAFASVNDPTSYCTLPARSTFLPTLRRADRRLAYIVDLKTNGERGQLYVSGGSPEEVPTTSCTTRFGWFEFEERRPYYGCKFKDPYDKEWKPIFYHGDGQVIGYARGLSSAIGEPSGGTILAHANEGLSIIDTRDATSVVKVTGLEGAPELARAVPTGFIVVTLVKDERRLWRLDRAGRATLSGKYAPLPARGPYLPRVLALASDGELYEYASDVSEGSGTTNQVVARTLKATRVIYSDASYKERGKPYVRLDARTIWGTGVFTAR